jgi:hypothetical protein
VIARPHVAITRHFFAARHFCFGHGRGRKTSEQRGCRQKYSQQDQDGATKAHNKILQQWSGPRKARLELAGFWYVVSNGVTSRPGGIPPAWRAHPNQVRCNLAHGGPLLTGVLRPPEGCTISKSPNARILALCPQNQSDFSSWRSFSEASSLRGNCTASLT